MSNRIGTLRTSSAAAVSARAVRAAEAHGRAAGSNRRWGAFCRAVVAAACLAGPLGAAPPQQLVPANYTHKTDSQGFRWDVTPQGTINDGSNDCFDGGAVLSVNNHQFSSAQTAMMTPDGSEYVLTRQVSNLTVTRRVRVDLKAAAVRYVDMFHNATPAPITANVTLRSSMGRGPGLALVTDSGKPAGAMLGEKDTGIIFVGHPSRQQLSVVFHLGGTRSKVRPAIQNQSNHQITFSYTLTVAPGKTASLLHGMAQRRLASIPSAKAAAALMKPFTSRDWLRDLPRDLRRTIVNLGRGGFGASDAGSLLSLESLGVERQAADVLAAGGETRLNGTASCKGLSIRTRHGELPLSLEDVAALAGPLWTGGTYRVFLADGQVLNGPISVEALRFTMNSGLELELDAENLDRLVMRERAEEGKPAEEVVAMLETVEGDRLALVGAAEQEVAATTPWGSRPIALDQVRRLFAAEARIGHHLVLRDGSRLFAFVGRSALSFNTLLFGEQEFSPVDLRRLTAGAAPALEQEEVDREISAPHLLLEGDNVLVGPIDLEAVHFLSAGQKIPVPPSQIRLLRRVGEGAAEDSGGPRFEAELWDGGTVEGRFEELVLPVRWGDGLAHVPTLDVVEFRVPAPTVPDSVRAKVAQWIRELGHPEYTKRKAAKEALAELGHLARRQLDETLGQTTDPEVRRSVEALLEDLRP